jgi:hypothetical protein
MSAITLIQLYEMLASKWGKETAESVTNFIELKFNKEMENKTQVLATKDDLTKLEVKISNSKVDIIRWVVTLWVMLVLMILGLYLKH